LGFVGAIFVVAGRQSLALPAAANWLFLALIIPLSLAVGNVYRTARWPVGATPMQVGAASNLLAVPFLLAAAILHDGLPNLAPFAAHGELAALQCLASLLMFSLFFRLQVVGGPTYLSQIGYLAAAVGLAAGVLVFRETYPALVWLGAAFILAGIGANLVDRPRRTAS
jgi:drug/metabolite transporter (DMT)-like permease